MLVPPVQSSDAFCFITISKCRITCQGSIGSLCCQHSHTHSNKGYCLLTHRLSLNETGAICRFINYTLSHTTSLSPEQREGERGLPFLLYINVRLQPSWLQLASLAHSVCPRDMRLIIMKWGKKVTLMSGVYTLSP